MTYDEILYMDVIKLISWLDEEFITPLPENLHTVESLEIAEEMFSKLGNQYAYLTTLSSYAKKYVRDLKRDKSNPKEMVEDMIDRKEAISNTMDAIDTLKSNLSRMLTTKQEIDKELNISNFNTRFTKDK
jgi:hypothetical protein